MSKKLVSDFRFGFEFEGFAKLSEYISFDDVEDINDYEHVDSFDELDCNDLCECDYSTFYDKINDYINSCFNAKTGRTHYDGSLKNYESGYQSFEYSSPVFKYRPRNLLKIKNFFQDLSKHYFGINETCGFHTHISFPGMSEEDAIWIIANIASNVDWINEFCYLDNIEFFSKRYANKDFLFKINENIKNKDFKNLVVNINDFKYNVLRIHPQGTLEWRGPRNFLMMPNGIDLYIHKLNKIIHIMNDIMSSNYIDGISKVSFFKKIKELKTPCIENISISPKSKIANRKQIYGLVNSFGKKSQINYNLYNISQRLYNKFINNPALLFDINNKIFLNYFINQLSKEWSSDNKKIIINFINNNLYKFKNIDFSLHERIEIIYSLSACFKLIDIQDFENINEYTLFSILENHIKSFRENINVDEISYILKNTEFSNQSKSILIKLLLTYSYNNFKYIIKLFKQGYFKDITYNHIINTLYSVEKIKDGVNKKDKCINNILLKLQNKHLIKNNNYFEEVPLSIRVTEPFLWNINIIDNNF